MPLRSAIGNAMTKMLFNRVTQQQLGDTQTGLRAIPNSLIHTMQACAANGYEFEFEMLFIATQNNCPIEQVNIAKIYLDDNKRSHFNPLRDSIKIYQVFLKFCRVSLASFLLDYLIFILIYASGNHVVLAVYSSRLISGSFNFYMNKSRVFKHHNSTFIPMLKYIVLATCIATLSAIMIHTLVQHGFNAYIAKIGTDLLLFAVSFTAQRRFIFNKQSQS